MQFTATLPVIGMDIAKHVFQLHVVDAQTGEVTRHKLRRDRVTAFFANRQKSLVAMEACGGAHHWARTLQTLGHEVKLLPAKHVRAFVLRDKTDARDAQAIWVAAQQPHIKAVPVKNEQQQACLTLHRMRAQLMKVRIMQTNALRGLLYEFGIVLPEGHRARSGRTGQSPGTAAARSGGRQHSGSTASYRQPAVRYRSAGQTAGLDGQAKPAHAGTASHTGHRSVDGDSLGIYCNRPVQLRVRQAIRRLAGTDAPTDWHRREDPAVGDIQTRRPLCEDHADARRSRRDCQESAKRLDRETVTAPPIQRGGRGAGQQAGPNSLGSPGQRQGL